MTFAKRKQTMTTSNESRLTTKIGTLTLDNPFLTASGTYGSGAEYADTGLADLSDWGGIVAKSVTLEARKGNPPPRVAETPSGMLNAIGLQNEGAAHFIEHLLPPLRARTKRVIINIAGRFEEDYIEVAKMFGDQSIDAVELNISCPNVKEGGIAFGVDALCAGRLTEAVRKALSSHIPLWVKLSPNVTDMVPIAQACESAGAEALTIANTYIGMRIDIENRRPLLANTTGGLSGPAIFPMTLRWVWQVYGKVRIPIIACGGVHSVGEVLQYLMAGACAVQIGTWNFIEPSIISRLPNELDQWLSTHNESVESLIAAARRG